MIAYLLFLLYQLQVSASVRCCHQQSPYAKLLVTTPIKLYATTAKQLCLSTQSEASHLQNLPLGPPKLIVPKKSQIFSPQHSTTPITNHLTFTEPQQPITKEVPPLNGGTNSLLQEGHFDPRSKWGGHPTPSHPKHHLNPKPYRQYIIRILQLFFSSSFNKFEHT